ncbi:MAG: hypothetical protein ACJ8FS_15280 [Sphingomicrobium sp.]
MPKHTLKLLILLMAFSVAPASARHGAATAAAVPAVLTWSDDSVPCPYERARLAAAAAAASEKGGQTTITLTDRVPPDAPLFGHGSGIFAP